mmetsp:Transcript_7793/g.22813  ORF Transcript_7793/g.22813 Transcript_7793/m.22813 type:complete len:310 (+) Transcript_7793:567-1496(+)
MPTGEACLSHSSKFASTVSILFATPSTSAERSRDEPRLAERRASRLRAEHRVASGGNERAAVPAEEGDGGADDARDGEEEQGAAAPDGAVCTRRLAREETYATTRLASSHAQRGGDGAAAMASAHGEHRQHGERVCIDCRPPKRLELEVWAHDVLAVGHLDRDDEEVGGRPRVRVPPVELEGRVGEDVPRRAGDQDEQRAGRRRRGQLAAEEEVVELRDDEGDAGAEDYDRLDVRVLQRLHVAIDGAHKHDGVVEVRLDLLPLESVHLGRSGDSQPQYEDGAHSKLCGRDKRRHWYVVDDELVDEKQRA